MTTILTKPSSREGWYFEVIPLSFEQGKIVETNGEFDDRYWRYDSLVAAMIALIEWDPSDATEPDGWVAAPLDGRYRPDGDPSQEYIHNGLIGRVIMADLTAHQKQYPNVLVENVLGPECVRELRKAKPRPPVDTGFTRDRLQLNAGAVGYWLWTHFDLNIFDVKEGEVDVDLLAERVTVRGEDYQLPHWCYLNTGLEPGDRRPTSWPGISKPEDTYGQNH